MFQSSRTPISSARTNIQHFLPSVRAATRLTGPRHEVYHGDMEPRSPASDEHGDPQRDALESAPARVTGIVHAAERAAANRVRAAEEEAEELLRQARAQAESARNDAVSAVGAIHAEAERVRANAQAEAEQLRAAA